MNDILIIDDIEPDVALAKHLIEHISIDSSPKNLLSVSSCKEALDCLQQDFRPDLIILDHAIHGFEGIGFLSEIESSGIKIVIVSNSVENFEIIDTFDCVVDFMNKPLTSAKTMKILGHLK